MKPNYYKQLDSLRFLSVLSVMIGHWIAWDTENIIIKSIHWGNGVIFFFVLSGFLITDILLAQKIEIDLKKTTFLKGLKTFYIRRTLRIFPIYYIILFILYYHNYKNTREIFPYIATYTSNFLEAKTNAYIGDFNHLWSLAVEEQFYIFWPICIFFIPQKHILKFIISIIIFSLISRFCFNFFLNNYWMAASYLTNNVMFALGIGALLAYINKFKIFVFQNISNSTLLGPTIFLIYVTSFYFIVYKNYFHLIHFIFDEFLFSILSAVIIARSVGDGYKFLAKWILENETLRHLGQISYGLYLFHLFACNIFFEYISPELQLFANKKHTVWMIYFLFTWLASEITFRTIEKPINSLKKYFKY